MAVDRALVERMRAPLAGRRDITEKAMFGGVCFMLRGNMLCASGSGGFMFRVGTEQEAEALARPGVRRVEMGGRQFRGFVWVDPKRCRDLPGWIALAEKHVGALPPKKKGKPAAAARAPGKAKRRAAAGRRR